MHIVSFSEYTNSANAIHARSDRRMPRTDGDP